MPAKVSLAMTASRPEGGPPDPAPAAGPVHGLLLAAGLSRRMGDANKLLLPVAGGQAMVRHCATVLLQAPIASLTVVTGHQATAVAAALEGLPVTLVHNPQYAQGQQGSVTTGLKALEGRPGAVLVALADMPQLHAQEIAAVIAAFLADGARRIAIPVAPLEPGGSAAARGNPIILPQALRGEALAGLNPGCRQLTLTRPELVLPVVSAGAGCFADVDDPASYRALAGAAGPSP